MCHKQSKEHFLLKCIFYLKRWKWSLPKLRHTVLMTLKSFMPIPALHNIFPSSRQKYPLSSKHFMSWTHSGQGWASSSIGCCAECKTTSCVRLGSKTARLLNIELRHRFLSKQYINSVLGTLDLTHSNKRLISPPCVIYTAFLETHYILRYILKI